MIKILIAEDHPLVRLGLKQIASETDDIVIDGEAASGSEVLEHVRTQPFDVVILDLNLPGRDGLDTLKDLKHEQPHLPVLVLSMHSEDHYAVRVLKTGGDGFLPKEATPEELVNAIRKIHAGAKYIRPSQVESMARSIRLHAISTHGRPPTAR
jgi:DNA-binding NarL/FixJ family response regulator